jgi:hypothetical protein
MGLGSPYTEATPVSVSKINFMELVSGTGAELAALDKSKHRLVSCTSTGSGYTLDHVYLFSTDGTTAIDLSNIASHTHTSSSDGGDIVDVFRANPKFMDLILTKTNDLDKANWIQTVTSTGSIANDTDGTTGERSIKLLTGATSGSGSTISYPHLQLNFTKRAIYQFKCRFSATTALAFHSGVGADDVTAADSNTRKFNAEVCTATNTNWFLRTADGTGNSTSDTGTAFTTSRVGIRIETFPDLGTPQVDMYIDAGTVFSKTSNIPTSSTTADNNLIKHSLKNSAAADKNLFMYGCRLRYTISDEWA